MSTQGTTAGGRSGAVGEPHEADESLRPRGGHPPGEPRAALAALAAAYAEDPAREPGYQAMRRRAWDTATRRAGVLVLFGVLDDVPAAHPCAAVPSDLDLLLVVRASGLRDHAGEIAFPGGGFEPQDGNIIDTALREAMEETGLEPTGVEVLGMLPAVPTVSRFEVTPVLAWWREQSAVGVVDAGESAEVFRAPVADLVDPANRCTTVLRREGQVFRMPAFRLPQGLLWGFTAGIVAALLDELGWTEPWDEADEVVPPGF